MPVGTQDSLADQPHILQGVVTPVGAILAAANF